MTELINAQKTTNKYLKRQTEYKRMAIIISLVALVVTIALTISFILFSINFEGSKEGTQKTTDAPRETIGVRGGNGGNGGGAPTATPVPTEKPSASITVDDIDLANKPDADSSSEDKLDWIGNILEQLEQKLTDKNTLTKQDSQYGDKSFNDAVREAENKISQEKWKEAAENYKTAFDILKNETNLTIIGTGLETAVNEVLNGYEDWED